MSEDACTCIKSIVNEIVDMNYKGDVKAIACIIIDKDGDCRTLWAHEEKGKLPMIAGISILQRDVLASLESFDKIRD